MDCFVYQKILIIQKLIILPLQCLGYSSWLPISVPFPLMISRAGYKFSTLLSGVQRKLAFVIIFPPFQTPWVLGKLIPLAIYLFSSLNSLL